jgi:prevent-host-death family protein
MEQLTIRDLRNRSAQALKRVNEEGVHFTVTSHGRPVAALIPLADASDPVRWTRLRDVRGRLTRSQADSALRAELADLRDQTTDDLAD